MVESIGIPHDVEEVSTFTEADGVKGINKMVSKYFPSKCCGTEGRDDSERTIKEEEIVDEEDPLSRTIELDRSKWFNETSPMLWTRVYDDSALYAKLTANVPETPLARPMIINNDDDAKKVEVLWTRVLDDSALYKKLRNSYPETPRCGPQEDFGPKEDLSECKTEEFLWTRVLDDNALYTKLKISVPEAPRCGPDLNDDPEILSCTASLNVVPESPRCGPNLNDVPETPHCGPPQTPRCGPAEFNDDDVIREEHVDKEDLIVDDIVAPKQGDEINACLADQFACVPKVRFEVHWETEEHEDKNIIVSQENVDPFEDDNNSLYCEDEAIETDSLYCEDEAIETDWESSKMTLSPKKGPRIKILERLSKERQNMLEWQKEMELQKKEEKQRKKENKMKKELAKQHYTRQSQQLQSRLEKIYNREQKILSMDMKLTGFRRLSPRKTTRRNNVGPSDVSTTVSGKTGKTGMEVLHMDF